LTRDEMITKARELLTFAALNDVDAIVDAILGMANGGPVPDITL
jgi:NAD(P)H-hydrate repair Nnr-like enzyme with NAD(P)H-hydrate epimerase domain